VKITRPNMADLSRTFVSSGESDSKAPPETSIDMPAVIMPVMEFCRPMLRISAPATTTIIDESLVQALAYNIAAGSVLSTPLVVLRRGVWRVALNMTLVCTAAIPIATNSAILAFVGPDSLFSAGVHLLTGEKNDVVSGSWEGLLHLPTDEWAISLEIADPVTALAVNRMRGSFYACHLL
jgi:hypothetical protein